MKIGLQIPHFRPNTPDTMRGWFKDVAQAVDEAGFDSLWMMDHFFQLGGRLGKAETDMLEGYTTLGYFAGLTEKIKLGLMVGGVIYRHPAIVVKTVTTLDVLSGGRAIWGIGAAWYEHETVSLGMEFPSTKERFEQLEDALQIAHHMWSGNTEAFEGKQFKLPYPVNTPQPLQKPHPPILIGGMGPKKTLRYVAQYADACNFFDQAGEETLRERLDILRQHCEDVGRNYDEIEKTILVTVAIDGSGVERIAKFKEIGFEHAIVNTMEDFTPEAVQYLTDELGPAVKAL